MREVQPLRPKSITEVPLPHAPLARGIAQIRFPSILAIRNPDKVSDFQEALRGTYPYLTREEVASIQFTVSQEPTVHHDLIWRLGNREQAPQWKVSLGVDFVALETSAYDSRRDFLNRFRKVVDEVERSFAPAKATRLGVRYIDQLVGEAVDRVSELIRSEILGIRSPVDRPAPALGDSIIRLMTEAQFLAADDNCISARSGELSANATHDPNALEPIDQSSWVLDLDMFASATQPFSTDGLVTMTSSFAESLYWLFRQMVTNEFLRFYGGEPCPWKR